MTTKALISILVLLCITVAEGSTLYVRNNCSSTQPVVFRGAYDKIYYEGSINPQGTYSTTIDESNCESCNIGINAGSTLLAEFSVTKGTIWWNLSTDAGYQSPPFAMYTSAPGSAYMYCNSPTCPDGHPGDSHINNNPEQYDLHVVYCGDPKR